MTRKSLALGALVAAGLAGLAFGGLLDAQTSDPAARPPAAVAAGNLLLGFAPGQSTKDYAAALERQVANEPRNAGALTLLGLAQAQRARETGDPAFLVRSEAALGRALRIEPENHVALTGLASLAAARHRFHDAVRIAERAVSESPSSAAPYGILGDALVELGRYEAAFAAFDRMARLKPSLASYARVSYARELLGDRAGALEAMRLAAEAGSSVPEHAAWTLVQLGNLQFDAGRLGTSASRYRQALARLPGYVYAEAGLARVAAARGQVDEAARRYRDVLDRVPLPEFAVGLSDTLRGAGRTAEAREAEKLVAVLQRLLQANGVRTELETALFDLNRDVQVEEALDRAREAFRRAPSVKAEDALGWALFKNGRCREARAHSARALRLGTRDALMRFHRGMIERCLGNDVAARRELAAALAINPWFSPIHAPVARELLS